MVRKPIFPRHYQRISCASSTPVSTQMQGLLQMQGCWGGMGGLGGGGEGG